MRDHPHLRHLTSHERSALFEFLSRLREEFGDQIAHVWLFGSKARGDFDDESDIDLLVVAYEEDRVLAEAIGRMTYDLSLEYGVLLCEHMVGIWRFAQMRARQEFVYTNIISEGVDLWTLIGESLKREHGLLMEDTDATGKEFK